MYFLKTEDMQGVHLMLWDNTSQQGYWCKNISLLNETAQDIHIKNLKPTLIFSLLNIMAGVVTF